MGKRNAALAKMAFMLAGTALATGCQSLAGMTARAAPFGGKGDSNCYSTSLSYVDRDFSTLEPGQLMAIARDCTDAATVTDKNGCSIALAPIVISDECACPADAGTASTPTPTVCLINGTAQLSVAATGVNLPSGWVSVCLLAKLPSMTIVATHPSPAFTVTTAGDYVIQTLVYDPATFDFNTILLGTTTSYQLNSQFIGGGGAICADIDMTGAAVTVNNCTPTNCVKPQLTGVVTTDATCGQKNGSATINLVGNETDFTFNWSVPGMTHRVENSLAAGVYEVTVTVLGDTCASIVQFVIDNVDGPQAVLVSSSAADCGVKNGKATLAPNNFTYNWDDGGTGKARTNLAGGLHLVTVTDPTTLCTDIFEVKIPTNNGLTANFTVNTLPACGQTNGSATINAKTVFRFFGAMAF